MFNVWSSKCYVKWWQSFQLECRFSISIIRYLLMVLLVQCLADRTESITLSKHRVCLERIWPDFQRCRDRQREHYYYGRFTYGGTIFSASSDVYQSKYKMECCSYWDLLDCVHRAAKVYCTDDEVDLKKLDKSLEMFGLNVPLYVCTEEYPKGSIFCKVRSWLLIMIVFIIFCILILLAVLCICLRRSK